MVVHRALRVEHPPALPAVVHEGAGKMDGLNVVPHRHPPVERLAAQRALYAVRDRVPHHVLEQLLGVSGHRQL